MKLKDFIKLDSVMDGIEEYDTDPHHVEAYLNPVGKNWVT